MNESIEPPGLRTKIIAVGAVLVVLLLAWRLGLFRDLEDPARAKEMLVGLGGWGYFAFVVTYALLQPFGVPGTVFIMVAPLIWPWPIAFGLSMVGTMCASVVGFSFARLVAREWIAKRIPQRFKKYESALAERGFVTVFTLRAIFWMPPLLHAFFGVSKVRFWTHFWGSFVGYIVPLFLVSFFGQKLFDAMQKISPTTWVAIAAGTVLVGLVVWRIKKRYVRA